MFKLRADTHSEWGPFVADNLDDFLADHAACERKASANAMHFVVRYPDRVELVSRMIDIAVEELEHFREVFALMRHRGVELVSDEPDPYINALLSDVRNGRDTRFMDRLILGSIIEYRGCERFAILGRELTARGEDRLGDFYRELAASESKHRGDFYEMALLYFDNDEVDERVDHFLELEADVIRGLELRPALH